MDIEQIRQALERQLGEGWTTTTEYLPKVVLWGVSLSILVLRSF